MSEAHLPVLPDEVLAYLEPNGGRYADLTTGAGGHSELILRHHPDNQLLGLDRDPRALAIASERLKEFGDRVQLRQATFSELATVLTELNWEGVDGILMDVGVSSMQIDEAERGFSYRQDGPLDMRMGPDSTETAADILNHWSEAELTRIFREFGDMQNARQVARAIVMDRQTEQWERTSQLSGLLERLTPRRHGGRQTPPAAACFQALRIAVNHELEQLKMGLEAAIAALRPGGRLVVIAFHSGEDHIVKHCFKYEAATSLSRPETPRGYIEKDARLAVLTKRPVRATERELADNTRAASARLRAARRLPIFA